MIMSQGAWRRFAWTKVFVTSQSGQTIHDFLFVTKCQLVSRSRSGGPARAQGHYVAASIDQQLAAGSVVGR
jgi:hypothetical protein